MQEKLTILFDYHAFHSQRFGGISRYYYEIISRMKDENVDVALLFSMNKYISHHDILRYVPVPKVVFKLFEGVFRKFNRHASEKKIRQAQFDIFHPTGYDPYFLNAIGDNPFVLTIHDMTHEMYPQYFSPADSTARNKRILAQKATRIIAISEYTKEKIVELLHIDPAKIDVIYHGIDKRPLGVGKVKGVPEKYILYVGERRRYKNFGLVAEAFAELSKAFPDYGLVLTGRKLSSSERHLFHTLGISDKVHVCSDISDEDLDRLYHNATMFVYPSLCEGFGIPILEAFAQDCPVVLSDASCFPEVGGDACEYFAPDSVDSLLHAMRRIIETDSYRNMLVEKGRERLKLFTWSETARKTEETYRKAISLASCNANR